MSSWLLAIVGAIYCWVGIDYARGGKIGMALAFAAYAVANAGFIIANMEGKS